MKTLLPGYFIHSIDAHFVTKKAFYFMYMPIQMGKYNQLKDEFSKNYGEVDWKSGMIEHAAGCGFGWIGLEHPKGDIAIKQEFVAYEIIGDYKQMKNAYKKIMKDYPEAKDCYNLYLTDPNTTPMEENKTWILLQLS